jgi:hypothetical protein
MKILPFCGKANIQKMFVGDRGKISCCDQPDTSAKARERRILQSEKKFSHDQEVLMKLSILSCTKMNFFFLAFH